MKPHACPVCQGQRTVSKPSWIAGDINTWTTASAENYPCPTCDATGIVWEVEPSFFSYKYSEDSFFIKSYIYPPSEG